MKDFQIDKNYKYLKPYQVNLISEFNSLSYRSKYNYLKSLNLLPLEIVDKSYTFKESELNNFYKSYFKVIKKYKSNYKIHNGVKSQYKKNGKNLSYRFDSHLETVDIVSKITGFPFYISDVCLSGILDYTYYKDASADNVKIRNFYLENAVPYDGIIYRGINFFSESKELDEFNESIKDNYYSSEFKGITQNLSWTDNYSVAYRFATSNPTRGTHGDKAIIFKCINNLRSCPITFAATYEDMSEVLSHSESIWDILFSYDVELPLSTLTMITCIERPTLTKKIQLKEINKDKLYMKEFLTVKAVKEYKFKKNDKDGINNWADTIMGINGSSGFDNIEKTRQKLYKEYEDSKDNNEYVKIHKEYINIYSSWNQI